MIRLGVIGLGTIFKKQQEALEKLSETYALEAICDKYKERQIACNKKIPFYDEASDFFRNENVDAVLIATPPDTHYTLAANALQVEKHVLLEKPAVLSLDELSALYKLADMNHVILHIAYHAAFAKDLLWYIKEKKHIAKTYGLGNLCKISCGFYDPYMVEGQIVTNKKSLGGSFIDSGVNELSVCDRLIDLSKMHLKTHLAREKDGVVFASKTIYEGNECIIELETAWDKGLNRKTTLLEYTNTKKQILLDHTNQQIVLINGDEQMILYGENGMERLTRQYVGVFLDYNDAIRKKMANEESTKRIHKRLLEAVK